MPRWLVILLVILIIVGSLVVIRIKILTPASDEEEEKPKITIFPTKPRKKTPTPTPSPTPTLSPKPPPTPSSGEGALAPGYIDCEWRGSVAEYNVTITVASTIGKQIIIKQDVKWRKNNEYYVEGKKIVNMTWTKEADYTIIAEGGRMQFHVSEISYELWEGCDVIEWTHIVYGPGGEKVERGNTKPTPGLSFIGFYNLTSNTYVAASEGTISAGGKTYHCWVYRIESAIGPSTLEVTFWFSPEAPVCGLVKATLKQITPESQTEMTITLTGSG